MLPSGSSWVISMSGLSAVGFSSVTKSSSTGARTVGRYAECAGANRVIKVILFSVRLSKMRRGGSQLSSGIFRLVQGATERSVSRLQLIWTTVEVSKTSFPLVCSFGLAVLSFPVGTVGEANTVIKVIQFCLSSVGDQFRFCGGQLSWYLSSDARCNRMKKRLARPSG